MATQSSNEAQLDLGPDLEADFTTTPLAGTGRSIVVLLKQRLENCVAERTKEGWDVWSRPGMSVYQTPPSPPAGVPQALGQYFADDYSGGGWPPSPHILSFYNNYPTNLHSYWMSDNGASPIVVGTPGAILPSNSTFASCVQYTASLIFVSFRNCGAVYNITTSTVIASNVSMPGASRVPGAIELDSTVYVIDSAGIVWGSNLSDATTWSSANFIAANSEPGGGVGIAKHTNLVVAFKEFSTEFFYDAQNPVGTPLASVQGAQILWGCADGLSIQNIDGELFWISRSRNSSFFVAKLSRMQHSKISTPAVERLLDDAIVGTNTQINMSSFSFRDSGHTFYGITFTSNGYTWTLAYDIKEGLWYRWWSPGYTYFPYAFSCTTQGGDSLLLGLTGSQGWTIFQMDEENSNDIGSPIQSYIYTRNHDFGTKRKKSLYTMLARAEQRGGIIYVRYSEDDYKTWSQWRAMDLNVKRPALMNCGEFRRRAWQIAYNGSSPFRLYGMDLEIERGDV